MGSVTIFFSFFFCECLCIGMALSSSRGSAVYVMKWIFI